MNKEKENLIEIISNLITINRVFEYIEDVTCGMGLIPRINSWFSIVYFMGCNLDIEHPLEEELQKKYTTILVNACKSNLMSYNAACLVYIRTKKEVEKDLKLFPFLKTY